MLRLGQSWKPPELSGPHHDTPPSAVGAVNERRFASRRMKRAGMFSVSLTPVRLDDPFVLFPGIFYMFLRVFPCPPL
jgi:hypothetical protein